MALFNQGEFKLHSGGISNLKIDCDALSEEDIETLAFLISKKHRFYTVYGVPRGGERLARALLKYASRKVKDPYLIVDDVLTTGSSMEQFKEDMGLNNVVGAVIFSRKKECASWIHPLFQFVLSNK